MMTIEIDNDALVSPRPSTGKNGKYILLTYSERKQINIVIDYQQLQCLVDDGQKMLKKYGENI